MMLGLGFLNEYLIGISVHIRVEVSNYCLPLQGFISGIGNWIADEVLYQVSLLSSCCRVYSLVFILFV